MNRSLLLGVVATALAIPALAAPLNSGLKPGQRVTPFHPKHLAGPLAGTSNCFPCTFQNRPQTQVWVNGDDTKNVLAIATDLSKQMAANKGKEFKALVVFVTDKSNEAATQKLIKTAAANPATAGVGMAYIDKNEDAVENYGINTAADVKNTVLVYKNWTVAENFVNLKADAAGIADLNKAISTITK